MAKSLAEIASEVGRRSVRPFETLDPDQVEGVTTAVGGTAPILTNDTEESVVHRASYRGEIRNIDDLVIELGSGSDYDTDNQQWPLTDLYLWLTGVAEDPDALMRGRVTGRLTVIAVWTPGDLDDMDEQDTDLSGGEVFELD